MSDPRLTDFLSPSTIAGLSRLTRTQHYMLIDALYERAELLPLDTTHGAYYCRECGSTDVQGTAWVMLNQNGREIGGDPPDDDGWCDECETRDAFFSEEPPVFCACRQDVAGADPGFGPPMASWPDEIASEGTTCSGCHQPFTTTRPEPEHAEEEAPPERREDFGADNR